MAANRPEVWAEIDVGDAVRRYVAHHRSFARDNAVARAEVLVRGGFRV